MPPLSLYIHIPWCIRKCPYCDFNSHKSPDNLAEIAYVHALIDDLRQDLAFFPAKPLHSIFIGGGTPSLFSAAAYDLLFQQLKQVLDFSETIEITMEANPGTVEQQRFYDYRCLGINRISLGIQSFNPQHLKRLGRIHDEKQAHRAIESARNAGFDNINIDLMHSLPEQTLSQAMQDLQLALDHQPEHLSWYQLTIEPNTVFYKKTPPLPTEDDAYEIETSGLALLNAHNFERYEISAFCNKKRYAQHNINYWLFGDYLGIGAGAHGKLTQPNTNQVQRTRKQRQPKDYLDQNKPFMAEIKSVGNDDLLFEFMLNTTRLEQAIPFLLFTERTGIDFTVLEPKLREAETKGFITLHKNAWQVNPLGRQFTNDMQALFLP